MNKLLQILSALVATALVSAPAAQAATNTLKFSDPSKPGRVVVQAGLGDIEVIGGDVTDVRVESEGGEARERAKTDDKGFRQLGGNTGFSSSEAGNVITITASNIFMGGRRGGNNADLRITVPRATSVRIERIGPGDMDISGISGDIEIGGAIGDVDLRDVSGGVVVESVNGDIDARLTAVNPDRPVAINVVHGDVDLHVPVSASATVNLRTLRGEMQTNFSEEELKIEDDTSGGMIDEDAAEAAQEAYEAQIEAREQAQADREEAIRNARGAGVGGHPPLPPIPPLPPMPVMPPMAGGQSVSGALNGGGTSITVTTIHGDITLRKRE